MGKLEYTRTWRDPFEHLPQHAIHDLHLHRISVSLIILALLQASSRQPRKYRAVGQPGATAQGPRTRPAAHQTASRYEGRTQWQTHTGACQAKQTATACPHNVNNGCVCRCHHACATGCANSKPAESEGPPRSKGAGAPLTVPLSGKSRATDKG